MPRPEPTIDKEFQRLIEPKSPDEIKHLRALIKEHGQTKDVMVWEEENIILDGHHTYPILKSCGIEPTFRYLSLPSREAAMEWILKNQLSGRNLNRKRFNLYVGKLYNTTVARKKAQKVKGGPTAAEVEKTRTEKGDEEAEKLVKKGRSPAKPKQGAAKFDWPAFEKAYSIVAKATDRLAEVCPPIPDAGPRPFADMTKSLREFRRLVEVVKKAMK